MSYTIEYLSTAVDDLKEITSYIAHTLCNPAAAQKLAEAIVSQVELLSDFPYSSPAYNPIKPLKFEYRKLLVNNYFVFYRVDEKLKTVFVARVIYARRDIAKVMAD